jgi:transcription elongation factor GreA
VLHLHISNGLSYESVVSFLTTAQAESMVDMTNRLDMSQKVSYYTKDGLEKLKNELSTLKSKGRPDIARQIAEARDKGDLSENAEYDAAKDAQGHLEAKIAQLENLVSNARLLDEDNIDTSKVSILSRVTIKNKKNGASVAYTLVSEEEADLKSGKISTMSPIGNGLLGKKLGDVAKIQTPAGEMEFEIVKIEA